MPLGAFKATLLGASGGGDLVGDEFVQLNEETNAGSAPSSVTLTSAGAAISWEAFDHLFVTIDARSRTSSNSEEAYFRINGISTGNLYFGSRHQWVGGGGGSYGGGYSYASQEQMAFGNFIGENQDQGCYGHSELVFYNINSDKFKNVRSFTCGSPGGSSSNTIYNAIWNVTVKTTDPVTSLYFSLWSNAWTQYSEFAVYGIGAPE